MTKTHYTFSVTQLTDLIHLKKIIEDNNMEKPNFSKLGRELGVSRDTVRSYYNGKEPKQNRNKGSKIDKHFDIIKSLLNDEYKQFNYISHLYRYLMDIYGDEVDYAESSLRRYVKKHFATNFKQSSRRISSRFETNAGEQVQFDYKENQTYIDSYGTKHSVDIAAFTFGYSRYTIRQIIADKSTESTLAFMAKVFNDIGGVPKQILIDNGVSLVSKARTKHSDGSLVQRVKQFFDDYGIEPYICMSYHPQTKGKVENRMKNCDSLLNYGGEFDNLVELNEILQRVTNNENSRICVSTGLPPNFLFKIEKEHLNELPTSSICSNYYLDLKEVLADSTSLISYKSKKYSVPPKYVGKMIGRRVMGNKLHLYYNSNYICTHEISTKIINYLPIHSKMLHNKMVPNDLKEIENNIKQLDQNINLLGGIKYE